MYTSKKKSLDSKLECVSKKKNIRLSIFTKNVSKIKSFNSHDKTSKIPSPSQKKTNYFDNNFEVLV